MQKMVVTKKGIAEVEEKKVYPIMQNWKEIKMLKEKLAKDRAAKTLKPKP